MIALILTAAPGGLRGELTRWLMEVAPGVFVGHVSARIREELWTMVTEHIGQGRALLVQPARNEQHLVLRTHGHDWKPTDFEGLALMVRPNETQVKPLPHGSAPRPPEGWSIAARRRKFGTSTERTLREK